MKPYVVPILFSSCSSGPRLSEACGSALMHPRVTVQKMCCLNLFWPKNLNIMLGLTVLNANKLLSYNSDEGTLDARVAGTQQQETYNVALFDLQLH